MRSRRIILIAGVATARAIVTLVLSLAFWAAAPTTLGWMPTTVMTASMSPAIEAGDIVVSRPVPREALLPGRVVLAIDPDRVDRLRLHRVAGIGAEGALVTKGDANPAADSTPLDPDAVLGVGVLRVPAIGLPLVWMRTGQVVPLAVVVAVFALCLAVALRRGVDDGPDEPSPRPDGSPPTRRASRARPARARLWARGLGFAVALATAAVAVSTPASASFSQESVASANVTAGRVTGPWALGCYNDGGAVVTWAYEGWEPRSFDLLVGERVVIADIPPWYRAARVPDDGSYSLFRTERVTVRTNVGEQWSAESAEGVPVGGVLFGFGRPFCR
ncbi:S24/S26 family peptidase [uncultured Microbacterium sp.]|uniref:S24/S26 family peptidase n=1 Tax=uncultured Microbacterium sp. TaxID=191216 RepID=UPI0025F5CF3D|nr:S24/S26 family peptidase [uncultured Microbacterium sp.]